MGDDESTVAVPSFDELMWPTLRALKTMGGSATNEELLAKVIELEAYPPEVQAVQHSDNRQTKLNYNLAWAKTYLKKVGAIENSSRGVWSLTKIGEQLPPEEVLAVPGRVRKRKHYMNCILSLAQAYEVFFSLFFRVELLYKPLAADPNRDLDEMNKLDEELQKKIKRHTFGPMRALFLQHIVNRRSPKNLIESVAMVATLPDPKDPNDTAIENLSDAKLVPLLKALKATDIHTMRNSIVHKQAYRPTREEAETAIEKTESILFPLTSYLQLHDDINWYTTKP